MIRKQNQESPENSDFRLTHPGQKFAQDRTSSPNISKRFVSFEDISEHVGLPLRTLYYLQKQGLAPVAYKFGRTYRVHISDYANWLALNRLPMR
jgi:predicted DNA-binding transcriptional regulator AlpA